VQTQAPSTHAPFPPQTTLAPSTGHGSVHETPLNVGLHVAHAASTKKPAVALLKHVQLPSLRSQTPWPPQGVLWDTGHESSHSTPA
jgi:hypothetical protein